VGELKILVQPDGGAPRRLAEGYADELELQSFLRDNATLIPMEDIRLGTPPLLCIGWEVFATSGSEDLLYVDETGLITVVETKLGRNAESRRKVVGQILEYAARTVAWTKGDLELKASAFLSSNDCPEEYRNLTLEGALRKFLEGNASPSLADFSYDEFLDSVEKNLKTGHIRLIIAVDEPPEPLRRIVDFVNRFSEHFEMYLFQLRRFRDEAIKANIFVPELFGQVPTTPPIHKRWDEKTFLAKLAEVNDPRTAGYIESLHQAFRELADVQLWGSGTTYGSYNLVIVHQGSRINLLTLSTEGRCWINFGWLHSKVPEDILRAFVHELTAIPGLSLAEDAINKYPVIPERVLADESLRNQFTSVVRNTITRIRSQ